MGSPINIDPFYYNYNKVSLKSDVYSVGIMMLETYFDMVADEEAMVITSPRYHSSNKQWDDFRRKFYDSNEDGVDQDNYKQNCYLIDLYNSIRVIEHFVRLDLFSFLGINSRSLSL
jgi:hypothetical protein